ncbi:cytochrome P450 2U1-like [Lytechinus variegatus]|uniref:cytochrome P450 2U1-like n=1 Tax=Lytechinus variegatus TaxID=7654 RepID=UPI001BB0F7B7|nr:cytochrome P450 2U1-like [Lytechinus variegatus]
MELMTTILSVCLGIATASLTFLWMRQYHRKIEPSYPPPPGPTAISIILNDLWRIISRSKPPNLIELVTGLRRKYGDIYSVSKGKKILVIISDPEMVKELFVKQAEITTGRDTAPLAHVAFGDEGSIIFEEGKSWSDMRRFLLLAFRKFGMGKKTAGDCVNEEAQILCREFMLAEGKPFDPFRTINYAVANIIRSITAGQRFDYSNDRFQQMVKLITDVLGAENFYGPLEMMPWLYYTPFFRKERNMCNALIDLMKQEVVDHRQTVDIDNPRDVIDMCLAEIDRAKNAGEETFFDESLLWRTLLDIYLAGTETVATTLTWAILYMAGCPDIQEKVCQEIDTVIGSEGTPHYDDRTRMPYTEATIAELLRIRPIAPLGIPHINTENILYQGYLLPARSIIIMNMVGMHLDPKLWPDPENFDPSRFLRDDGMTVKRPSWHMPFGAGRRICLGEQLAKVELFLFFTNLLQRFTFRLPDGILPDYGFGHRTSTLAPKKFQIIASPR